MEEGEVVYLKVFDEKKGDVVFEGKVSTDVAHELVLLRCFRERCLGAFYKKASNEEVKSFRGLRNNVELVAGRVDYKSFVGLLYVGADDKVLKKSKSVPSCECVMMTVWRLSHEECEKVFKYETLEELQIHGGELRQIPREIGGMKKLKKLGLVGLDELKSIPEEIGGLSNLEELRIEWGGIGSLPKRLNELKMLKSISFERLYRLQLNAEDLVVFSKLKHLKIKWCKKLFTPPLTQSFLHMIKSTTDLCVLELNWGYDKQESIVAALEENGSIVDGGEDSESYAHFFKRNKENHERAMECVVHLLAIRRWRNALNHVPKEMMRILTMMLWMMRCDAKAWSKK